MLGGPITNKKVGYVLCTDFIKDDKLSISISQHLPNEQILIGSSNNKKTSKYNCSKLSDSRNFLIYSIPTILFTNIGGLDHLPSFYHTERDTLEIIDWVDFVKGIDIAETLITNNEWYTT